MRSTKVECPKTFVFCYFSFILSFVQCVGAGMVRMCSPGKVNDHLLTTVQEVVVVLDFWDLFFFFAERNHHGKMKR